MNIDNQINAEINMNKQYMFENNMFELVFKEYVYKLNKTSKINDCSYLSRLYYLNSLGYLVVD